MRFIFSVITLLICFCATAQDYYSKDSAKVYAKVPESETTSRLYLGFGMGLNNDAGLIGFSGKVRLHRTFFLRAAAGLGSWGTKFTVGAKYEMKYTRCWGFGLSYSMCTGISDYVASMETAGPITKEVTMDLLPASTINLTSSYNLYFRKNKLFYLEFGYAFPLELQPYRVKDGSVLTPTSESVMRLLQPGGMIVGLGFMFGL
jgi:hypothetical protein